MRAVWMGHGRASGTGDAAHIDSAPARSCPPWLPWMHSNIAHVLSASVSSNIINVSCPAQALEHTMRLNRAAAALKLAAAATAEGGGGSCSGESCIWNVPFA